MEEFGLVDGWVFVVGLLVGGVMVVIMVDVYFDFFVVVGVYFGFFSGVVSDVVLVFVVMWGEGDVWFWL